MPNCFRLVKDGEVVNLPDLNDRICREVLGIEPHPTKYDPDFWFGVGLNLAMGYSLQEISDPRITFSDGTKKFSDETRAIAQWLIDHSYTSEAWAEVGRRN